MYWEIDFVGFVGHSHHYIDPSDVKRIMSGANQIEFEIPGSKKTHRYDDDDEIT